MSKNRLYKSALDALLKLFCGIQYFNFLPKLLSSWYILYFKIIDPPSECVINSNFGGSCMQPETFTDPKDGFPGDTCTKDVECKFASRSCVNNTCVGIARYGHCIGSADCIYNHYCSDGICLPLSKVVFFKTII